MSLASSLGRWAVLLGAIFTIFALSYVLGYSLLVRPVGNDAPLHLAYSSWLYNEFPEVPNWYPYSGGGFSIRRAYPLLSHYMIASIARFSELSVLQAFHFLGFVALPIGAAGIYLFCSVAFRNRIVGIMAAIFFLLSPISWFWIHEHGFIASIVAFAGIPFALAAFTKYLNSVQDNGSIIAKRGWLLATVILVSFVALAHLFAGAAVILTIGITVLAHTMSSRSREHRSAIKHGSVGGLTAVMLAGFLLAFSFVPIYLYSGIANRSGGLDISADLIRAEPRYLDEFLSLTAPGETKWDANGSFPLVVVGFSLVALPVTFLFDRKGFVIALSGWAALLFAASTEIKVAFTHLGPLLGYFFQERAFLMVAALLIPIGAGFGCWGIARILAYPADLLARSGDLSKAKVALSKVITAAVAVTAIAIGVLGIYALRSSSSIGPEYLNYGVVRFAGVRVSDIWGVGSQEIGFFAQLAPGSWPPFAIRDDEPAIDEALRLMTLLPDRRPLRIDISPYIGRMTQNLVSFEDISQIAVYTVNAELAKSMTGYKGNVLFSHEPEEAEFGSPGVLNELAKWFGIAYVYLQPDFDDAILYDDAGWTQTAQDQFGGTPVEIWQFPEPMDLATLSTRPLILVIGQLETGSFETVFRLATRGAIPFEDAFIVESNDSIDSYSVEELRLFDGLILHGYSYDDSDVAWALLEEYVREGGSLFVDTGWQWTVPEWEFEEAPAVLPVSQLSWTNFAVASEFTFEAPEIGGAVDPTAFAPLEWEGQSWGVSSARQDGVRDWGKIVLSVAGQPLIVAGEYGQGRIIWSGMNMVAHAYDKDNDEEVELLHNLISWLTSDSDTTDYSIAVERDHPDRVVFRGEVSTGTRAAIYWREAYYPDWHAYLEGEEGDRQELPIYRAGPGFMLIPVETASRSLSVALEWETPFVERIAALLSLLTAGGLFAYVFDGLFLEGKVFNRVRDRIRKRTKSEKPRGSVEWLDNPQWEPADEGEPFGQIPHVPEEAHEVKTETDPGPSGEFSLSGNRDSATVEALWDEYVSRDKPAKAKDGEVSELIGWWRKSRHDHGE